MTSFQVDNVPTKRGTSESSRVNSDDPEEDGMLISSTNLIAEHNATVDFSIEVTASRTIVEGIFLGEFTERAPDGGDSTNFLAEQMEFIKTESKKIYGVRDGNLPDDGVWVATGPAGKNVDGSSDFGLGVFPAEGHKITFGILLSAISGISKKTDGDGLGAPSHKKSPFIFDIYSAPWGLVGNGVLRECEDEKLDCFAPYELQKPS